MKKNKWYRNFGLADDKYIEEARPEKEVKPAKSRWFISLITACTCACVACVACGLWLFVPFNTNPPDVSHYAESEYYDVIQKLNVVTFEKPKHKNNAEKLWNTFKNTVNSFGGCAKGGEYPPAYDSNNREDSYQEITDNQVAGIIEADRIKRSDTHIYYLDGHILRVFSINKENSEEVGSYELYGGANNFYVNEW